MPEKILLADYNRKWPEMFQEAKKALVAAVGSHVEQIEHIGSTSVPDLAAKPVIDILIGVRSLDIADTHCNAPIVSLGYEYLQHYRSWMQTCSSSSRSP